MKIPYYKPHLDKKEERAVKRVLRSGHLTTGKETALFEKEFVQFSLPHKHAVAVSSCTAALHLSLVALGIGPGDRVALPTYTFTATAEAVLYTGATPVFIDCTAPDNFNMDIEQLKKSGAKAVIPVHIGGRPIGNMVELHSLEIPIIEDAAHMGPDYMGIGKTTCFSFYANKPITTGEGGMVVTSNKELAGKIRLLRLHGIEGKPSDKHRQYEINQTGYKYNMTDIQAAIGREQLKKYKNMLKRKAEIALKYWEGFYNNSDILVIPHPGEYNSWHLYPILVKNKIDIIKKLQNAGIGYSVHYKPLNMMNAYKKYATDNYPNAEYIYNHTISLPIYPDLKNKEIEYIIRSLK